MQITDGSYEQLFNLGDYNNRKMALRFTLEPDDDPAAVLDQVRQLLEGQNRAMKRATAIEEAQYTLAHPDEYLAYEVERAQRKLISLGLLAADAVPVIGGDAGDITF